MEASMEKGLAIPNHHHLPLKPPPQPAAQQKTQRNHSSTTSSSSSPFCQSTPVNDENVPEEWVVSIRGRLEEARQCERASSWSKLCIYRVPNYLRENDDKAFVPQLVSLGPYHHKRNERLGDMESHKLRALDRILKRTNQDIKLYLDSIKEVETKARTCYEGPISLSSHDFVEMMVLDGCFMLEIFRGVVDGFEELGYAWDDPIFSSPSVMHSIRRDMVMLENQIPLFILDRLFGLQFGVDIERSHAAQLALRFLDRLVLMDESLWSRNRKKWIKYAITNTNTNTVNIYGLHCLDILRRKPLDTPRNWMRWKQQALDGSVKRRQQLIRCATELRSAGVKFKKRKTDRFWDVKFENGTLFIPRLLVHDGTKSLLLNLKAYEQCHHDSGNEVTSFLILMDNLINSDEDVKCLIRSKILEHWLGSDGEVANFFNCLCRQVAFDFQDSYISKISADVNNYCDIRRNEWLAIVRQKYFKNPWTIISLIAGVVLFVLTLLQTIYTVLDYHHHPNSH